MDLISKKFKYLLLAQSLLKDASVPPFYKITSPDTLPVISSPSILRSAISGEASTGNLLSGKSISIPNIKSQDDLKHAYQTIIQQAHLEEVILQHEINWDKHLTLIVEKDFIFIEMKLKDIHNEKTKFLYWTPLGHTHDDGLFITLKKTLDRLTPLTDSSRLWLMELGLKNNDLFLFQIQPVDPSFLGSAFSQNLIQEMLLSRQRFQKSHGLLSMIRAEWNASKFRKKFSRSNEISPSWIFLNWEFIFHYFRIYCLQKGLKPGQDSFSKFLTVGHEKNWMGEILRLHFKMANQLRLNESYDEMSFIFDTNPAFIFIGKGKFKGLIGEEFILLEELTPQIIYGLTTEKIILTKTFSLLGHGILAAIEQKIKVVAGIPDDSWEELHHKESIFLDFEERIFEIQ